MERLLDAAEEQICAVGIESFTVADVVARAELSVGAFYARFPDKRALLHAVQDTVDAGVIRRRFLKQHELPQPLSNQIAVQRFACKHRHQRRL